MTVFYRYYRPMEYSIGRAQLETKARGGVCIRFQTLESAKEHMWFTHARCHEEDLFSKSTAREITDQRAEQLYERRHDLPLVLLRRDGGADPDKLLVGILQALNIWAPKPELFEEYLSIEYRELFSVLHKIIEANTLAQMMQETHLLQLAASQIKGMYESLARKRR